MKVYGKDYLKLSHKSDLANGLTLSSTVEYAQLKQLFNNTSFNISNPDHKSYTTNLPQGATADEVKDHNAFLFTASLEYTPRCHYSIRKGLKQMHYSDYPTFKVFYQKGINGFLNSKTDFDYLGASIRQSLNVGFNDQLSYKVKWGKFVNTDNLFFADFYHFSTNRPFLMMDSDISTFRLLPYYRESSANHFLEGHLQYTSDRLLLKRLPLLNQSLVLQERVFLNYLEKETFHNYWEVGYGLSQIFLLFDVEVVTGFRGQHHHETGIKIKVNF